MSPLKALQKRFSVRLSPTLHFCFIYIINDTGYQVEKKGPGGLWEKLNELALTDKITIPNLTEGLEYEFRVAAVTDAGVGEYSLNTAPVKLFERRGLCYGILLNLVQLF